MKVVKFDDAETFEPEQGWKRVSLAGSEAISIEYYQKHPGNSSPLHTHKQKQVTIVLKGKMKAATKSNVVVLERMDSAFFEANEQHRIENIGNSKAIGIDIFVPKRSFDFWKKRA